MNALAKPHSLDVGIGGVHVRLRTDSTDFIALMADRFRGFVGHVAQPDHVFDVEIVPVSYGVDEATLASANDFPMMSTICRRSASSGATATSVVIRSSMRRLWL